MNKLQKKTFKQKATHLLRELSAVTHHNSVPLLDRLGNETVDLAEVLGFSLTTDMLKGKFAQCSEQKDALFRLKAGKLREIGISIARLDERIAAKRNLVENEIDARLREARVTLEQTNFKMEEVSTALAQFEEKFHKSEQAVVQLKMRETSLRREKEKTKLVSELQAEITLLRDQRHKLL